MRRVGQGDKTWREVGVGSGDVAALLNCSIDQDDTVLDLWARIVRKRDQKGLPKMQKVTLAQGSPEWLEWRRKGLGGSEVGSVLGSNPYADSRADRVWARKLPSDHPDALPEVKSNFAMARGTKLEPDARALYENLYGWKAEPVCVIHPEYLFARASLDGCREDGKVTLEIKASGVKNHTAYLQIGQITDPFERQSAYSYKFPHYRYQILYQLLITGAELCHFVGYSPDPVEPADRFVCFEMYPEPEEMDRLLQRVIEFWNFVERREPPPAEWLMPCWRHPDPSDLKVPSVA